MTPVDRDLLWKKSIRWIQREYFGISEELIELYYINIYYFIKNTL